MKRRSAGRWILGGAAAAALAAGAAWRLRGEADKGAAGTGAAGTATDAGGALADSAHASAAPGQALGGAATAGPGAGSSGLDIWQLRFDQPGGGELAMASLRGQPLLLNFWGSWCAPCVAEMPELDRFAREVAPAGWRVLGLAVDNPKAVREFLSKQPVSYTIALAGFEGADLSRQLGNTQGGLPFTVVFNRQGVAVRQKAGQTHLAELRQWAQAL